MDWWYSFDSRIVESVADAPNAIIFIDTSVSGYDALAIEWQDRGSVVLIDSSRDGIEQVMAALAGRSNLDAIHFVSHGSANNFILGTTSIGIEGITGSMASAWASIGAKLSANGDILIYGCNVSLDDTGQSFIDALAIATGADVAASTDATGGVAQGGDWTLEAHNGSIEASTLVSENFAGLLQLTNSGAWLISGNSASTVIDGITVTITYVNSAGASWTSIQNQTFNNIGAFSQAGVAGGNSLDAVWNTPSDTEVGQVTISFSHRLPIPF